MEWDRRFFIVFHRVSVSSKLVRVSGRVVEIIAVKVRSNTNSKGCCGGGVVIPPKLISSDSNSFY